MFGSGSAYQPAGAWVTSLTLGNKAVPRVRLRPRGTGQGTYVR